MKLIPYEGLQIVTTLADNKNVRYLLDESGKKQLTCDECSGNSFVIKVLIEADMEISVSHIPLRQAILRSQDVKEIRVVKVKRCANCGSVEFIHEGVDHY